MFFPLRSQQIVNRCALIDHFLVEKEGIFFTTVDRTKPPHIAIGRGRGYLGSISVFFSPWDSKGERGGKTVAPHLRGSNLPNKPINCIEE